VASQLLVYTKFPVQSALPLHIQRLPIPRFPMAKSLSLRRINSLRIIVRILLFYTVLETILKLCDQDGYVDLSIVILLIELHKDLGKIIFRSIWKQISPIVSALFWGLVLKFVTEPNFRNPRLGVRGPSIAFTIALMIKTLVELRRGCKDSLVLGVKPEDFCSQECAKTLFGTLAMLVMIRGIWIGWKLDGGLVDILAKWEYQKYIEWQQRILEEIRENRRARRLVGRVE
jgi:hypothetical protein